MTQRHLCIGFLLLALAGHILPAQAQQVTWQSEELELLIGIRDRARAQGGWAADLGILRRYTPMMDHEYRIDLRTMRFTVENDAAWFASRHAVRSYAGSIDKSHFATRTDFRHRVDVSDRLQVSFFGRQQEDHEAQRFYVEARVAYALGSAHRVGLSQTAGSYKPDLDTELFYRHESPLTGSLHIGLNLLDAANNFIFDGLGVDPALEDTLRSYDAKPRLLRFRWLASDALPIYAEVYGGVQPRSDLTVTTHSDPDFIYRRREHVAYGALLLSYPARWTTFSARTFVWREGSHFTAPAGSSAFRDYRIARRETSIGLRAATSVDVSRRYQLWIVKDVAAVFYGERQWGVDFGGAAVPQAFDLYERRLELGAGVSIRPVRSGFLASVMWHYDGRDYNDGIDVIERYRLRFAQWQPNSRATFVLGYEIGNRFLLESGVSYDIDGDIFYTDRGPTRFDGPFARLSLTW